MHAEIFIGSKEVRDRLFNNSVDLVCIVGFDGYLKLLNPAWHLTLDWSSDELRSRPVIEFVHPEDRLATENAMKRLCETQSIYSFENRYLCKDGTCKSISWNAYLLANEEMIFATGRDITERKRVEHSLQDSERFLNSIIENIPAMIFVKDAKELRFVRFNRAGEELLGYSRSQLVGKNDYDFFPKSQADFFTAKDRDVLQSRALLDIPEEAIRTSAGEEKILHTKKIPILDNEGNPQYLLGISEDITERKHAELELKKHRDQLETLIRQLTVAKERADVANQAKSTFLSSISHELRTPLNAILGYTQILQRDKTLGERQVSGLNTIRQSGEHLLMLINDILDLAKIEAGKLELTPHPFSLPAFLRTISDIIGIKAEQKGLEFKFEAGPDLPAAVQGDETRLRQIVLNLLSNAVKFTDFGKVTLRVHCLSTADAQARLRIEVEDSGIGISAEHLKILFQPFEQVGDVQRRAGGTGLGLAISRQLVRMMNSDIHVESQPDAGSLFWFEVVLPVEAELAALPEQRSVTGYQGARRKVLIVDDVAANRAMLADLLSNLGFETYEAADGMQGVEQAQALGPDLVVMDMLMPEMDGLQATRQIRATPGLQAVPIIAVSASATPGDQAASLAADADAFCAKPIDQACLLEKIGALLGLNWVSDPLPPSTPQRKDDGALVVPSRKEMDALHKLAQTGNMRDIRQWAEQLESQDRRFHPFAVKLRNLATSYQSKAILALVEQYRDNAIRK